jgi:hypothetical protein
MNKKALCKVLISLLSEIVTLQTEVISEAGTGTTIYYFLFTTVG